MPEQANPSIDLPTQFVSSVDELNEDQLPLARQLIDTRMEAFKEALAAKARVYGFKIIDENGKRRGKRRAAQD